MTELEKMTQELAEVKARVRAAKAEEKRLARRSTRVLMAKSFADYKHDVIDKKGEDGIILAQQEFLNYVNWFNRRASFSMEETIEMVNSGSGIPGLLSQGTFFRELAALSDWKRVRLTNNDTGSREWVYIRVDMAARIPAEKNEIEKALGL